jgi:2-iminobutanoate/2-iminopropanoate deaminase
VAGVHRAEGDGRGWLDRLEAHERLDVSGAGALEGEQEAVELGWAADGDVEQRILVAGDAVGPQHVRHLRERASEVRLAAGTVGAERDEHERLDGEPHLLRRHDGTDALHHAFSPQPLHAPKRGGRRQPGGTGERDVGEVTALLQHLEDYAIYVVKLHHRMVIIARAIEQTHDRVAEQTRNAHDRRMQTTEHNPTGGIYAATPDYIHALELRASERLLFVSGTMGLDPSGIPAQDVAGQLELIWANLQAILATAQMTSDNVVQVRSYLRDAAYAEANATARMTALNGRRVATTSIVASTLEPTWLVEIELIAAA